MTPDSSSPDPAGAKQRLTLFDFDGTVTRRDTLIEIIRYICGTPRMIMGFLLYSPLLVLMKLHLYPNWKVKERILCHFFGGMKTDEFQQRCRQFAADRSDLLRPRALEAIRCALREGDRVIIVSASMIEWVAPFFYDMMERAAAKGAKLQVIGTELEEIDGELTGCLARPNCYGEEKVKRVNDQLTVPREEYYITAYGDSRGDREMLAMADEAHYKPFRK